MVIREARATDVVAIQRLIGQLADEPDAAEFRRRFERVSSDSDHCIIVAEVAGRVVGVLHVFERPALEKPCEAVVQALVVDSAARSGGIGAALMHEAEAWAARRNLSSSALYTRVDRDRARAFYERIGYRQKATSRLMGRDLA
jgi:GNAT superfamily N-acetyltransferase